MSCPSHQASMPLGASTRRRKQATITPSTGQHKAMKRHTSLTNSASPQGACGRKFGLCCTDCILLVRRTRHRGDAIPMGTPPCDHARTPLGRPGKATWHRNGSRNSICPCWSFLTCSLCGRKHRHNSKVLRIRRPRSRATDWDTLPPNWVCNPLGKASPSCKSEAMPISPKCPWQKSQCSACKAQAQQMSRHILRLALPIPWGIDSSLGGKQVFERESLGTLVFPRWAQQMKQLRRAPVRSHVVDHLRLRLQPH